MKKVCVVLAVLALLGLCVAAQAVVIDTVRVGDAGNAGELSGANLPYQRVCGSVGYSYNIGKYEVTAAQYAEFLNAKAKTDTYGLYNTTMSRTDYGSGITRSGASGSYTYSVASDFVARPVNFVSYWDSCRFANWLNNGQGNGDTETGAYTLTANGINNNTIARNANWTWAVTSEDEWYKAAYYKGGGANAGYWLYPTSNDAQPGRDMADASGNNVNYYGDPYPIDSGKYTTVAGEFQNSDSPYGTFDQGGNVWEWNEAIILGAYRGIRGGSVSSGGGNLRASLRYYYDASGESYDVIGFRVSQIVPVPEPSSIVALAGGLLGIWGMRRRRA